MAARKQPAKKVVKQEEQKPIEEKIIQIEVLPEVIPEPEKNVLHIRQGLYDRMMKIGGMDLWERVLEMQTAELEKRYRS